MPTKAVLLWRLCDWYIKKKPAIPPEQMLEVYRAMTKTLALPDHNHIQRDKANDPYCYEPLSPGVEQVAGMYRFLVSQIGLPSLFQDYRLDFPWQGHKAEFAKFFDTDDIKEDQAIIKYLAKRAAKHATKSG